MRSGRTIVTRVTNQPKKTDPHLADRIKRVLDEQFAGNKSEMARAIGLDPASGTVHNWLRRNRNMDSSYAFILQDKFKWNARWILEGVGPERLNVLDPESEQMIEKIRALPPERRRALAELLGL